MINYGLNAYEKAAYVYLYLYEYLGRQEFLLAIREFYDQWKIKHPTVDDLVEVLESSTGKDCAWITPLLSDDPTVDFKIYKVQGEAVVVNNSSVALPFQVTNDSGEVSWFKLLDPGSSVSVGNKIKAVNEKFLGLELNGDDNHIDHGKLAIIPIMSIDNTRKKEIYFTPLSTWNFSDGLSLGTVFYNSTFPSRNFQWLLAPQVGLSSDDLIGNG